MFLINSRSSRFCAAGLPLQQYWHSFSRSYRTILPSSLDVFRTKSLSILYLTTCVGFSTIIFFLWLSNSIKLTLRFFLKIDLPCSDFQFHRKHKFFGRNVSHITSITNTNIITFDFSREDHSSPSKIYKTVFYHLIHNGLNSQLRFSILSSKHSRGLIKFNNI